jgi:hypothetical protein
MADASTRQARRFAFRGEEPSPSATVRLGSSGHVSNDNEGVADSGDDQNDSQDIHEDVTSGVVADLIGDREGRGRQHEMRQDFHAPFSEHEIGHDNAYEAYNSNEIIDGLHPVRPTVFGRAQLASRSPYPNHAAKP